jgi:hypothetical protein
MFIGRDPLARKVKHDGSMHKLTNKLIVGNEKESTNKNLNDGKI